MLCLSFLANLYYNLISAWGAIYMVTGFQDPLPWHTPNSFTNSVQTTSLFPIETYSYDASIVYFENQILGLTDDTTWSNYGTFQWKTLLALFVAWCFVCVCTLSGVKNFGRVVHFTVAYPVFVFISLIIVGLYNLNKNVFTFLGEFLTPDWHKLGEYQVSVHNSYANLGRNEEKTLIFRYGGKPQHKYSTLWALDLAV